MTSRAYYNEHDRYAAEWLRALIREGLIRSIVAIWKEKFTYSRLCG